MATLESTIHGRWAAKTALNTLLAATKFFTGQQYDKALPYAILSRESSARAAQSNRQRYDNTTIRFSIYHANYDLGRGIATELAKQQPLGFHQDGFDITGDGRVINMVKSNDFAIEDEQTGVWLFVIDFEVTYRLP